MTTLAQFLANLEPTQRIRLSSGPLVYRKAGQGRPLLLLHGWGGSSRHWATTFIHFAELRTVYAPDLPGYGDSPPMAEYTSAERLAELVIEFADTLGIETFDINGHSFGAAVAIHLAARYPQRVQRLVISSFGIPASPLERAIFDMTYLQMNTTLQVWHPWWFLWQPWQTFWQLWMLGAGYLPPVSTLIAQPFFHQFPDDFEVLREGFSEFILMDPRTSMENTISLGNPALRQDLGKVAAPTLLVSGSKDKIVPPATIESAAALLRDCRVAWIENCGHVPMIEQPQAYHRAVDIFLNEQMTSPVQPAAA
jgi:pimeloyl-ACP methyl ester carboxylesterase